MSSIEKNTAVPGLSDDALASPDVKKFLSLIKEKDEQIKNSMKAVSDLKLKNEQLQAKINWFEEQIKLEKSKAFSRRSEKHEVLQFDFFGNDTEEHVEETVDEEKAVPKKTRAKKTIGRRIDTSKLPREKVIYDLDENDKCCTACGNTRHCIGEDISEQIEYIPAQIKVIKHVRPKYACRTCDDIKVSPKPDSVIPKCMAGPSLITEVILGKYQRHIPLYRQSQILLAEGVDIPDNTLGNWALTASEALAPLGEAMWGQLKESKYIQADETPVKMLSLNKKGYMWCYFSIDPKKRQVMYEYHVSRGAEVVNNRIAEVKGVVQSDGYSGYNGLRECEDIISAGCFAHCRRKFVDVIKISNSKRGKAHDAIEIIGALYEIEREAKEMQLSPAERKVLRQEKAKPILDKFTSWLTASYPKVPPKSKLGGAIKYALNQWSYLTEYINHGEVEIDNNWVENKIRWNNL